MNFIRSLAIRRIGFTALEVVVATALASLMMVAVLGVLGGIAKKEQLLDEQTRSQPSWQHQFRSQLIRDFESASEFRLGGNSLVISGFGGRRNGLPSWEPVEIHYRLVAADDQSLLLRQVLSKIQPSEPFPPGIVCLDVDQIRIESDGVEVSAGPSVGLRNPRHLRVVLLKGEEAEEAVVDIDFQTG